MKGNFEKKLRYRVDPKEVVEKHKKLEEEALKERKEALEIAKQMVNQLKAEKVEITTDEILNRLEQEDFRAYQLYRTSITVLGKTGAIPEVEGEFCK